jgi:hypothetical protein
LSPEGGARLIPIAIMVDGKFYDASAYKASPVPFAIWGGNIYEAERTGVSQGLFTVGEAVKTGNDWFAEGKWQPAGSAPAKSHHQDSKPKLDDEDEGPPKLRRPEGEKSSPSPAASTPAPDAKPDSKTSSPQSPSASAPPSQGSKPSSAPTQDSKAPSPKPIPPTEDTASGEPAPDKITNPGNTTSNDEDPNRPVLSRGKTRALGGAEKTSAAPSVSGTKGNADTGSKSAKGAADKKAQPQKIPAISDANGPDPRPYAYDLKPEEEQQFRKKMLALATEALQVRVKEITPAAAETKPAARTSSRAAKGPQLVIENVQFRAFDLWNTNEPVMVLSAQAHLPEKQAATDLSADLTYFVTLVVKVDMYGDLRKLSTIVTDTNHLDQTPRLELIDAVDADGDGRGELLFRQVTDAGNAWGVYRAGADQLFPLFEGTPNR